MDQTEENKLLVIILSIIAVIVLVIVVVIFIKSIKNQLLTVEVLENQVSTTTTRVKLVDQGFKELNESNKIKYNDIFMEAKTLIAFNNAINNDFSKKNINLIQSETSKFKFIYTYLKYIENQEPVNFNLINLYSNKIFNVSIFKENIDEYKENDLYKYNIKEEDPGYCLKAVKEKDFTLLIDMVIKDEETCNVNATNYNDNLIMNKIKIEYEIINEKMIYKSFVIVK